MVFVSLVVKPRRLDRLGSLHVISNALLLSTGSHLPELCDVGPPFVVAIIQTLSLSLFKLMKVIDF